LNQHLGEVIEGVSERRGVARRCGPAKRNRTLVQGDGFSELAARDSDGAQALERDRLVARIARARLTEADQTLGEREGRGHTALAVLDLCLDDEIDGVRER